MSLEQEIVAVLRESEQKAESLTDPRQGRSWQLSLMRTLGGHVEDRTQYQNSRSYRFDCTIPAHEVRPFRSSLRVLISGVGLYATHTFVQGFNRDHWWSDAIRTSRIGFYPEDEEALRKLRAWYQEFGIKEVDPLIQGLPLPEGIRWPARRDVPPTLFQALFNA